MGKHCPQGKAAKTVPFLAGVCDLGHTEGKTGTVSHGLILQGGHNITLKEKRHHHECATIKINARDQSIQTQNLFDLALAGNTSGIPTLISSGTMILAGGNNITLSQMGNGVTISGPNQSIFDLTLSGNTSGTLALISSGTMTLAGGNNITLSQVGNAITISAAALGAGSFSAGVSDIGNTTGTTGTVANQLIFAGGNNITLSQSTNGQSATITISAFNQSIQTQNIINDINIGGHTSGTTANISSGTLSLIGGYNITLSQIANTVTISGPEALTAVVSDLGNTTGLTGAPTKMDKLIFVGGNNITLSQTYVGEDVTITINAQTQSLQTQSIVRDVNIIGNTSGTTADITSGTLFLAGGPFITLSQDGNSISFSGISQSNQTASIVQAVAIGGHTSGTTASISSGTLSLIGGYNITLSQDQNTITMSGPEALTAVVSNLGNTTGLTGAPTKMDKLIFVGGNNITLSQTYIGEDVTITINAQTQSLQTGSIIRDVNIIGNTSGTTADITSGTLFLAGGNNVTLSQNSNSITISARSQSQQTQNIIRDVSIGGNTSGTLADITSGTLFLAGNYNITLSQNQNSISISGPDELIAGMSTLGNTLGDNTLPTRMESLILVGGNNITLSQSTFDEFATVTISAANQSLQTESRFNLTLDGNTSGTLALVSSGILTLAGGNNITLSQIGNAITISAQADVVTQFSAGMSTLGNTTGTAGLVVNQLVLAGGNNITLSQSINGQSATITISAEANTNIEFSAGISNIGNTSGTSGTVHDRLVFAGGNNITLSQSINGQSATITISARNQTVQTQNLIDVTVAGNTSGTLALISSGTLTLAGGNNITLSQDGNAITISAFEDIATQFSVGVSSGGNTSGNTGTFDNQLVLVGGNNITLSQSMNGQSGTITISAFTQTIQTQGLIRDVNIIGNTDGTTAQITSGTLSLAGGDNITLSQNGNAITISAAAVGAGSFTAGMSNLGNTAGTTGVVNNLLVFAGGSNMTISQSINGQSATMTFNFATIGAGSFTAGMSNLGNTSGTSGVVQNELVFAGGNNITLSQSVNGQSATLTISAQSQSLQTGSIVRDVNIIGNTSGTTADITSGTLYLAGGSNITLFQDLNSITIRAQSQSQQTQNIIRDVRIAGNTSGTLADISSGTISIVGGNNITLSQNQNSITISGAELLSAGMSDLGNTDGTTGLAFHQLVFVGGNEITLSQSIDVLGHSATITIDGPADTISMFTAGMSNLGNTDGTTGVVYNQLILVGGNEITLSQSINGQSATITIAAAEDSVTQFSAGASNLGNFAGTTGTVDNQVVFVGGNNVTLSQSIGTGTASQYATLTISAQSQSVQTGSIVRDVNIIGNTVGTTADITSGTLFLAGGNNITLSQVSNNITISAFNQTVQTGNLIDVTLAGNTTGTLALISSGTMTLAGGNNIILSQDGNAVTIEVSEIFIGGVSDLGNTSGTTGTADERIVFVGGNNVTLIQSVDVANNSATITISAQNQSVQTGSIVRDVNIIGNTSGTTADITSGTLFLAGGNNITLSQISNNITISAFNQSTQTQNLIDVTISGNTSGTLALISSGTMTLAGGTNITLSQIGNIVTISGANQTFRGQMSNLGNTAGTSAGTVSSQLVLVGGNNITLSQSVNAGSATLTINAQSQSVQTQNLFDLTLSGNTSGTLTIISSGTLTLAGGNNITLSQSGNAITISAFTQTVQTKDLIDITISGNTSGTLALISSGTMTLAGGTNITLSQVGNGATISGANQTFRGQMSNLGNTAGTSAGTVSSQLVLVGGNNITLSQSVNAGSATLTINAQSQSVQTQNLVDVTLAGNTSGTLALISSGTMTLAGGNNITLSQSGNIVTISAASQSVQTQNLIDVTLAGNTSGTLALISSGTMTLAGGNNITLSQSGNIVTISGHPLFTAGMSNLGNTSGTSGVVDHRLLIVGGNNITISQSLDALSQSGTITISAGAGGSTPTLTYWANADQTIDTIATSNGRFWLFPLNPTHDIFPGNMTANTALLNFSATDVNLSSEFTHIWKVGIYTINGVSLSLLDSVSTTFGNTTHLVAVSSLFRGERFLTIHSSAWSSQPTFSQTQYFVGMVGNSNTDEGTTVQFSIEGFRILESAIVRSGTIGVGLTSGNTSMGIMPWIGVSGATRNQTQGLPTNVQLSELVKTGALYGFIPHIQFDNISSNF